MGNKARMSLLPNAFQHHSESRRYYNKTRGKKDILFGKAETKTVFVQKKNVDNPKGPTKKKPPYTPETIK